MSFTDHKITQFVHRIVDLPDQPNLPADELKARFDSSPEELRQAVNGICDDAATLSGKVDSILAETFDGVVEKSMLSEALADELDAKAEAADLTAEQTAREAADSALSTRVSSLESTSGTHTTQIAQKCQLYCGTYTGDGEDTKTITLNFTPKAVLVVMYGFHFSWGSNVESRAALAFRGTPAQLSNEPGEQVCEIITNGFRVHHGYLSNSTFECSLNYSNQTYLYLAFY